MNIFRNMPSGGREVIDKVVSIGDIDYVKDGEICQQSPVQAVMIKEVEDLDLLESYEPGTIAFTAGFVNVWQKDVDGEWVVFDLA